MILHLTHPFGLLLLLAVPLVIWIKGGDFRSRPLSSRLLIRGARVLLIVILTLALCDPRLVRDSDRVNLFFVVDGTDSIRPGLKSKVFSYLQRAGSRMGPEDQAGLILFGENPSLETDLDHGFAVDSYRSQVNRNVTGIRAALQMAVGRLPAEGDNRIVLLSDGNETLGRAEEMGILARSLGIKIYAVPLPTWFSKEEVVVEKLETPEQIHLLTPFEFRLVVSSGRETAGQLTILKSDNLLEQKPINLHEGKNVFLFRDSIENQGLYLYRAVLNVKGDPIPANNEATSFTQATRRSRILYVGQGAAGPNPLSRALIEQGLDLVRVQPEDLPADIYQLADFSAVILDNISGLSLSYRFMENLEDYVKDLGGGLIMIGGDQSFGAGGYRQTPVEDLLPVYMDAPTSLELPAFILTLVIDKSASMAGNLEAKNKLEGAKIAAFSAVEMLNPTDRVGLLAFDSSFQWVVPITPASKRKEIADKLATLKEGGGTELYPALGEAYRILKKFEKARKHIIILSDGLTLKGDFEALVRQMNQDKITFSTVALGRDADLKLMRSIARWGGGRSYHTNNVDLIPRIFMGETRIAAKQVIHEERMVPQLVEAGQMLSGLPLNPLPPIRGQVITYEKPGAEILMQAEAGPLLADWTYGLGRSVAFTSDLTNRWGRDWVRWEHYGRFVSQMVKWVQKKEGPRRYRTEIERKQGQALFRVDVTDAKERFVNQLRMKIRVLLPSKADKTVVLDQTAPGRYGGRFPVNETGEYYITLYSEDKDEAVEPQNIGYSVPYSEEYATREINDRLLSRLADMTGGQLLNLNGNPPDLFQAAQKTRTRGSSLWPYLTLTALLLLLADVALRKFMDKK